MVVTFDQEACLLYYEELKKHLEEERLEVVISATGDNERYKPFERTRDQEEALLDRFRDEGDPLKILIVTAKLLTGFDAPILQAMYLDKPLRDHTLLQAVTRTNRTYGETKSFGLIVDYLGVFDDIAKALSFDEGGMRNVISSLAELKAQLPEAVANCLAYFEEVDRTLMGYEGLIAAQEKLPSAKVKDAFAADYSVLNRLWEALSPDPVLTPYEDDYRWLSQVYRSVQPARGGKLLWHALGAKTIALIHEGVQVDAVRSDLDEIVLDEATIAALLSAPDHGNKAKTVEIKLVERLRRHTGDPKFKELSKRLGDLQARHERGLLHSVGFLKQLLELARDLLQAEKETPEEPEEDRGKAALTELFQEAKSDKTPVVVERVVNDIDEIVRLVRFPGWQQTSAGEREVKKALRQTLLKYQLHKDTELFGRAYGYIREYY